MSIAFLVGTPFVVGALTIYGLRDAPQSLASWIFCPWASIALMLLGCAISLLEGSICLALMAPLFLICASIGGLLMGLLLRFKPPSPSQLGVFAVLPFLLFAGERQVPLSVSQQEIRQSIEIDASPQRVWSEILTARDITAQELPLSVTHLIGVPKPVEGVNVDTPEVKSAFPVGNTASISVPLLSLARSTNRLLGNTLSMFTLSRQERWTSMLR